MVPRQINPPLSYGLCQEIAAFFTSFRFSEQHLDDRADGGSGDNAAQEKYQIPTPAIFAPSSVPRRSYAPPSIVGVIMDVVVRLRSRGLERYGCPRQLDHRPQAIVAARVWIARPMHDVAVWRRIGGTNFASRIFML